MEQHEVKYKEYDYIVWGDYEKAQDEPRTRSNGDAGNESSPACFYIEKVLLADNGTDVTDFLTSDDFESIQEKILQEYYED